MNRHSTTGYCVVIGGNIFFRKSKKQIAVTRSSVEAECWAMASHTCELVWVKQFLQELKLRSNN